LLRPWFADPRRSPIAGLASRRLRDQVLYLRAGLRRTMGGDDHHSQWSIPRGAGTH